MSDQGEVPSSLSRHRCECEKCWDRGREIDRLRAELQEHAEQIEKLNGRVIEVMTERDALLTIANERTQIQIDQANEHFKKMEAEIDTLKTALTAPTKEEIDLRAQLSEASAETVTVQYELGELLHAAEAERDDLRGQVVSARKSHAADLADALSHLRAGIEKLKHTSVEIPIDLHKACHTLTHIVAALPDEK